MNEQSRKALAEHIKSQCDRCSHKEVCQYQLPYRSATTRILHEAQADAYLVDVKIKCKFYGEVNSVGIR